MRGSLVQIHACVAASVRTSESPSVRSLIPMLDMLQLHEQVLAAWLQARLVEKWTNGRVNDELRLVEKGSHDAASVVPQIHVRGCHAFEV